MDNIKVITPALSDLKTGTPAIKIGDDYLVGGIGGNFLPGGSIDVSDTTATNHDVLSGKYFYTAAGVRTEGSIIIVSAQPTPTVSINAATGLVTAKYTPESGFCEDNTEKSATLQLNSSNVPTLLASNIKKDVVILGNTGTYEGSGGGSGDTWYKCASVEVSSEWAHLIVSGNSSHTEFIGTYNIVDTSATGYNRVWRRTANNITYEISYIDGYCWDIHQQGGSTYQCYNDVSSDPWGSGWNDGASVAKQATTAGWTGYLLTIGPSGITYASTVTTGLAYTTNIPVVNGVYSSDASKRIYEDTMIPANIKKDVAILGVTGTNDGVYLYKCAAIIPSGYTVIVSGAGETEVNDTYYPYSGASGTDRVWRNADQTEELFYYSGSGAWVIQRISGGIYMYTSYESGDPWSITWGVHGSSASPAPTVAQGVSVPTKWTGYKAVQDSTTKVWSYESTLTTDTLSIAADTPTVGNVYNADATATATLNGSLVFYASLTSNRATAETGQALSIDSGITFSSHGGRTMANFNGSSKISFTPDSTFPTTGSRTLSCVCDTSISYAEIPYIFGWGDLSNGEMFTFAIWNAAQGGYYYGSVYYGDVNSTLTGGMAHLALVYDASSNVLSLYVNGVLAGSNQLSSGFVNTQRSNGCIGFTPSLYTYFNGYISECKIWSKALSAAEITAEYNRVHTWS